MTKRTKLSLRPVKTQISLGIHPVWSESLLSAWRNIGSSVTHWAHCKDWSDWVDAQADLSLRWVHRPFSWFVMRRLKCQKHEAKPTTNNLQTCEQIEFSTKFSFFSYNYSTRSDSLAAMWMSWQLSHKLKSRKWHWRLVPLPGLTSWHLAPSYHEVTVTESESLSTEHLF